MRTVLRAPCILVPALLLGGAGELRPQITRPTPEERAAAETASLFRSHDVIRLGLETDVRRLRDEREGRPPQQARLVLQGPRGEVRRIPMEVDVRGNFRREKRNCSFPPLRFIFPPKVAEGTPFEGEGRLKLVTPCRHQRDSYERMVLREYLLYRVLGELTPASFRVRLLHLTYHDTSGREDPLTRYAFLIEDDDRMAARNDAQVVEFPRFHPATADAAHASLVALFQFMIGNTDWSPVVLHNVELVRTRDLRYLTVPYDFDFSGAVDAPYATPDPELPIRTVRDRLYRGFCRDEVALSDLVELFGSRREAIRELVTGFGPLPEGDRRGLLRYFDDFYDVLDSPGERRRQIEEACRKLPA